MPPEVIVVDSDDEIECTGQFRGVRVKIEPEILDLTSDGDEDKPQSAAVPATAGPSRRQPIASTSSVRQNSEPSLRRTLEKGIRIVTEKATQRLARPSSGIAAVSEDVPSRRAETIEISDGEEEDYAALDINNHANWNTRPAGRGKSQTVRDLDEELAQSTRELVLSLPAIQRQKEKAAATSIFSGHRSGVGRSTYDTHPTKTGRVWSKLSGLHSSTYNMIPAHRLMRTSGSCLNVPTARARLEMTRRRVLPHFSPGSVNTVAQSGPITIVASCVLDGDVEDDERNILYNREGTLKVLYNNKEIILHEHEMSRSPHQVVGDVADVHTKTYTVNDVQFDPADSTRFASCGRDKKIILWNCANPERPVRHRVARYMDAIPEGLQYKPSGSIFAAWTNNGTCLLHSSEDAPMTLHAGTEGHPVQSVAWGRGRFSNKLYTTSGTEDEYAGCHKCFDVATGSKKGTSFGNTAAGECLDVDPTGTWLAHATCGEQNIFELTLYDLKNLHRPITDITLPPFTLQPDLDCKPRVQQVLLSPDSIYLAIARSDNVTHVYDARFLGRRVLYEFPHGAAVEATKEDGQYGIYKVEWLDDGTHRLNLVTCGADGCVRLWDVKQAYGDFSDTIVAQSTSYAGWFSLGDIYKGEIPLVMGDGSGNVVVCDRIDTLDEPPRQSLLDTSV